MAFWKEQTLEVIGNKLGKIVTLEKDWETNIDPRCAIILVELDMKEVLYEELVIVMHACIWKQRLDYWKLLFRYYNYCKVGHMQKDFSLDICGRIS